MPQQNQPENRDNNLHGILYMLAGVFVLTIMDVAAKLLVESDYSPFQILAIRGWIITACFTAWFAAKGQLSVLKTSRVKIYIVRGIIGFCAPFFFFSALGFMPIADVVVLFFAAPFIMTVLSIPLLKETVGPYRWAAIIIGFVGVLIVAQPGGGDSDGTFQLGVIYAIAGCLAYSLIQIMTRRMGNTEPPVRIVYYFNAATLIIGSCFLPFVWKPMTLFDFGVLLVMTAVAVVGHILMTTAFVKAPISVIVPFEYTALLWSTLFGLLIWGDFPANHVWLGAAIIVASGIFMIYRERVHNMKPKEVVTDI